MTRRLLGSPTLRSSNQGLFQGFHKCSSFSDELDAWLRTHTLAPHALLQDPLSSRTALPPPALPAPQPLSLPPNFTSSLLASVVVTSAANQGTVGSPISTFGGLPQLPLNSALSASLAAAAAAASANASAPVNQMLLNALQQVRTLT